MRLGRRMVLTLLASALPTVALANGIDFDTGTFLSGTIGDTFKARVMLTEVGTLGDCTEGLTCENFKGGGLSVGVGGPTVFTDSLSGSLAMKGNSVAAITAALILNSEVGAGGAVATLDFKNQKILVGSSDVSFASPVPEPSTLFSLATGLIGLAGTMRRKLWT